MGGTSVQIKTFIHFIASSNICGHFCCTLISARYGDSNQFSCCRLCCVGKHLQNVIWNRTSLTGRNCPTGYAANHTKDRNNRVIRKPTSQRSKCISDLGCNTMQSLIRHKFTGVPEKPAASLSRVASEENRFFGNIGKFIQVMCHKHPIRQCYLNGHAVGTSYLINIGA